MPTYRNSGGNITPRSETQWAPSITSHDPNPPIPLESDPRGDANGLSMALGVVLLIVSAVGLAVGDSSAAGAGQATGILPGTGLADGTSTASGTTGLIVPGIGTADGDSTAPGVFRIVVSGTGVATSTSTAQAVNGDSKGLAAGDSLAIGVGQSLAVAGGIQLGAIYGTPTSVAFSLQPTLPNIANFFTIMGWFRLPLPDQYNTRFFYIGNGDNDYVAPYLVIGTEPATKKLNLQMSDGATSPSVSGTTPVGEGWFHITYVKSAQIHLVYLSTQSGSADASLEISTVFDLSALIPSFLLTYSDYVAGTPEQPSLLTGIKAWESVLTVDQIRAERDAGYAIGSAAANLVLNTPLRAAWDLRTDLSSSHRYWDGDPTTTGTDTLTGTGAWGGPLLLRNLVAPSYAAVGLAYIRREETIRVRDVLNDSPNTADFYVQGVEPEGGQDCQIVWNGLTLFAGTIQNVEQVDPEKALLKWGVSCVDYVGLLNRRRPRGKWTDVSASTIVQQIINQFALGFTANYVVGGLPDVTITLDGTKDFAACLTEIAKASASFWYVDYSKNLHFFQTETSDTPDPLDDTNTTLLLDPPITRKEDYSQIRNRVYVRGAEVGVGKPGQLAKDPVTNEPADGQVIRGDQIIDYTSNDHLSKAPTSSCSIYIPESSPYDDGYIMGPVAYAVSYVLPEGETMRGPATGLIEGPYWISPDFARHAYFNSIAGVGYMTPSSLYYYKFSVYTRLSNQIIDVTHAAAYTSGSDRIIRITLPWNITSQPQNQDPRLLGWIIWRTVADAGPNGPYLYAGTVNNFIQTTYDDATPDSDLRGIIQGNSNAGYQVFLSNIPQGPENTRQRKIYRTKGLQVNLLRGSSENWEMFLLTTIEGRDQTTYLDTAPDSALGALPLFADQKTAPVYDGTVTPPTPVTPLDPTYLWVQRDDFQAQADLAEYEGGDGVRETVIIDESLDTNAKCVARAEAELAVYARPITTVTYSTRDTKTRSGKTISINLTTPPIYETLTIQEVNISEINEHNPTPPRYSVTASSVKYTLEDLLRQLALK